MNTLVISAGNPEALPQALALINAGQLVAFPTDTVYGVGALAFDYQAIEKLYAAKLRDAAKAIPILIGDFHDLERITSGMNELALRLAQRFWPGPLTLIVPRHPALPNNLSISSTIGVRMPDHPVALELLKLAGPLAVTSANLSGQESPSTAQQVFTQLNKRIALLIDGGQTPGGASSTVIDCTVEELTILRPGPITAAQIQAATA